MKLKDLFENKEYTFGQWAKDEGVDLNSSNFDCVWAKITSLQGAPTSVGGYFDCRSTKITSLQGAPTSVGGYFDCRSTKITSLQGAPTKVGGGFGCSTTKITSLEGAPTSVGGWFDCSNTKIDSLKGAPTSACGYFNCSNTKITSLEGATPSVGSDFNCTRTNITSLKNVHHYIQYIGGHFFVDKCPIKSNVLGVLWIGCDGQGRPQPDGKAPMFIWLHNKQVERILNKYLKKIHSKEMTPREALLQAQNELIDADLDEYAEL